MNICFFNDIDELGGGELWALRASRWLPKRGHRASIAAPYGSPLYCEALKQGLDIHGFYRRPGHPFDDPLRSFLERRRVDIVYCTLIGRFPECDALERIADQVNENRAAGRLAVILKTGLPPWRDAAPELYGFGAGPAVRRLHVVCDATRRAFLEWEPLFPENFVEVWREGADLERFDPSRVDREEARRRWEIPLQAKAVVCLGRLAPEKGQRNVLRSAPAVLEAEPNTVFLLAGEGDDRAELENLADSLGLNGSVRFLGGMQDIPSLLGAADLVVHPSFNDSLPNALVEAAAMARPIVASNIEGIPEIVTHGETGLLVEPWDVDAQASSVATLLTDEPRRNQAGRRGRARVLERFDFDENMRHWVRNLELLQAELDERPNIGMTQGLQRPEPLPVLFLMSEMRTGGEETELRILAESLDQRRFRLLAASVNPVNEPSPAAERLRELRLPVDEGCHSLNNVEHKVEYLRDVIRKNGVRLCVACQDTAVAHAVFQQIPPGECRLIEHGGIVAEAGRIPKDRTARYVGVSPAITAAAAPRMADPNHALTIPSMVDTDRYRWLDKAQLRGRLGLPSEDCVITFVGRLDPKKRIEQIIQAAGAILPTHQQVRFLIVGPPDGYAPDYAQRLYAWSAQLTQGGRFTFAGPRGDIPEILAASDILVLPSVGEGMSHVINEAGAAGLAVVSTDDGAARLQLDEGEAGVLIPPDDSRRLALDLAKLIGNPARRRKLGSHLRSRVEREYSKRVNMPRWERLFEDVAAGMTRAPLIVLPSIPQHPALPFPAEIQIQTNTLCNATCVMCPYPEVSKEFEHGKMDEDLYREILDQCANEPSLWRIEPFLMNEPFTDKRMVDWIALAKQRVPRATVTVTTNGSLLRPKVTDRLMTSGLDAIWFSFNGATKETYEKIMGVPYDRVVHNIDYLLSVKPQSLRVYTNMIETNPMAPEIDENIRRWRARGVESGPSKLVNRGGNVRNFTELNYRPLGSDPTHVCDLLYHKMYILHSGDAVLCCMDWRRTVIVGNVKEQTLRQIWNGERYRHYRRLHEEGRVGELDLCSTCSYVLN